MRYCPVASEIAVRVFSISTGLAASTVTPGSTAPDASFTVPARATWAYAAAGRSTAAAAAAMILTIERMSTSSNELAMTHRRRNQGVQPYFIQQADQPDIAKVPGKRPGHGGIRVIGSVNRRAISCRCSAAHPYLYRRTRSIATSA